MKQFLYHVVNAVIGQLGRRRSNSYDITKTLVLSGHPRGGTTWLAEVLAAIPGYHVIWEPLHLGNNPDCVLKGFGWSDYWPVESNKPSQRDYLRDVLTGRDLSTRTLTRLNLKPFTLLYPRGYLVKFVNGNPLMPWIAEQFNVRPIVVFRHPCAVVASQLRHGSWDQHKDMHPRDSIALCPAMAEVYPEIRSIHERLEYIEEARALAWSVQTMIPLRSNDERILKIHYESMVEFPNETLDRISEHLRVEVPPSARQRVSRPSKSTKSGSVFNRRGDALAGWKSYLSSDQIRRILNVVQRLGVSIYDDSLRPLVNC